MRAPRPAFVAALVIVLLLCVMIVLFDEYWSRRTYERSEAGLRFFQDDFPPGFAGGVEHNQKNGGEK